MSCDTERNRLAEKTSEPSFYAQYSSKKRQRAWLEREHGVRHPIRLSEPKLAGRSLATSLGVRVARHLGGPALPERLQEPAAERFVVKPIDGWSGRGDSALVREGHLLWSVLGHRAGPTNPSRSAASINAYPPHQNS